MNPAADPTGRVNLDSAPPQPPLGGPHTNPGINPPSQQQGSPLFRSPQAAAIQGVALIEQGSKLLTGVLPGLTPMVADVVSRLRETVPRALAEMMAGGSSLPTGAGPMGGSASMPPSPGAGSPGIGALMGMAA